MNKRLGNDLNPVARGPSLIFLKLPAKSLHLWQTVKFSYIPTVQWEAVFLTWFLPIYIELHIDADTIVLANKLKVDDFILRNNSRRFVKIAYKKFSKFAENNFFRVT